MGMEYVRKTYKVPAKRGGRVAWWDARFNMFLYGRITSASHYVHVRFDGECHPTYRAKIHPTDLIYLLIMSERRVRKCAAITR
jgi:hypothetical protein